MGEHWTCTECGIADDSVTAWRHGVHVHHSRYLCIGALKRERDTLRTELATRGTGAITGWRELSERDIDWIAHARRNGTSVRNINGYLTSLWMTQSTPASLPITIPGQLVVVDTIPGGEPMYFPFSSEGVARNFAARSPRRTVHRVLLGEEISGETGT